MLRGAGFVWGVVRAFPGGWGWFVFGWLGGLNRVWGLMGDAPTLTLPRRGRGFFVFPAGSGMFGMGGCGAMRGWRVLRVGVAGLRGRFWD